MNDIRLTDLRNFVTCAQFSTMGEAARQLNIAQPSLSESILRLERDLGSALFYRSRSGINLTASGRAALEKAKEALKALHNLQSLQSQTSERVVTIGCHPVVASYTLPFALLELQNSAPDLHVQIKHGLSRVVQTEVQCGRIDIGIVVNALRTPDLVVKKLAIDDVAVWHGPKKFNSNTLILDPELLQSQSILRRWRSGPKKWVETSSLELIARLTFSGYGYGILPKRAVDLTGLTLTRVETLPSYRDEIFLVFRPEFGKLEFEKQIVLALQKSLNTSTPR